MSHLLSYLSFALNTFPITKSIIKYIDFPVYRLSKRFRNVIRLYGKQMSFQAAECFACLLRDVKTFNKNQLRHKFSLTYSQVFSVCTANTIGEIKLHIVIYICTI